MLACECLNILVKVSETVTSSRKFVAFPTLSDAVCFEACQFFKMASGPLTGVVSIQHEALVHQQMVENWRINHCLNCDSYVFAAGEGLDEGKLLVNANLLRDEAHLKAMMNSDKYSMPFKIILKPLEPQRVLSTADVRVRPLLGILQDFIQMDSLQTEAAIRKLSADSQRRRQQAEIDFQRIVTIIESTSFVEGLSNENIGSLTPPVTPESISDKMIDSQLQLPLPIKINNKTTQRDGFTKHSNAINQQHITRTIDFDDDIFEIDGMRDESKAEFYNHADNDEDSEEEQVVEKRVYNRGRSGSIARSAPISMPMLNHQMIHAIDSEDGKPANDHQMDIASSMQMLTRSIHVESVFGELPARPVPRYNLDF